MNKMDDKSYNKWDFESSHKLIKIYSNYFEECNTLLEIGSLHGKNANQLKNELKIKKVYIFEANPYSYEIIKKRYPQYNLYNYAMGNKNQKVKFNAVLIDNPGVSSVLNRPDGYYKDKVNIVEVDMLRGDKFITENNIGVIDLCKIDVEGFTYEVLEGFGDYVKNIKFIEAECETVKIWENQKTLNDINHFLKERNFKFITNLNDYPVGHKQLNGHWVNKNFYT